MKKVSLYSLIFVFLFTLSPVQIKADPTKSTLNVLMNDELSQVLLGGTVGFGIGSIYCFKEAWKAWNRSLNRADRAAGKNADPKFAFRAGREQKIRRISGSLAKSNLLEALGITFLGVLCLAEVGGLGYLTHQAIKQAKS